MGQLVFESSALPLINAPLLQKTSLLTFDESISVAHPDAALGGINEIIESAHSTTKLYLGYILITQAVDFMDERTREFNSLIPFYTTAKVPEYTPFPDVKRFLCLLGSPKPHKVYFLRSNFPFLFK